MCVTRDTHVNPLVSISYWLCRTYLAADLHDHRADTAICDDRLPMDMTKFIDCTDAGVVDPSNVIRPLRARLHVSIDRVRALSSTKQGFSPCFG